MDDHLEKLLKGYIKKQCCSIVYHLVVGVNVSHNLNPLYVSVDAKLFLKQWKVFSVNIHTVSYLFKTSFLTAFNKLKVNVCIISTFLSHLQAKVKVIQLLANYYYSCLSDQ